MKTGDFKLWRSPVVCWMLFALFFVFLVLVQTVTTVPYPNSARDELILSLTSSVGAIVSFVFARRASKLRADAWPNQK